MKLYKSEIVWYSVIIVVIVQAHLYGQQLDLGFYNFPTARVIFTVLYKPSFRTQMYYFKLSVESRVA